MGGVDRRLFKIMDTVWKNDDSDDAAETVEKRRKVLLFHGHKDARHPTDCANGSKPLAHAWTVRRSRPTALQCATSLMRIPDGLCLFTRAEDGTKSDGCISSCDF